ncbi:alpha/beta hydrolase [Variovorax sp. dw_308]|uniref:alpha/beta hydrolase n=1 Tax=Variovorax sp. dw_308 TaxID=2721546 RepID=UPI001C447BF0|nr:phospholipase [Variovorax sp. dw_308]
MTQPTTRLHLPLKFLERPARDDVREPWLLVLLHGVGSNEGDLFGLAPMMPTRFHVLSLRAPNVLAPDAYAWFQFHVAADGRRTTDKVQERESRFLVGELAATACEQLGIPPGRTVVGGFSQGGIMSLSLLLTQPARLRAAMVWHSRLLPEVQPDLAPAEALAGKALWISHGAADNVIPPAAAQHAREFVASLPVALSGADFPGGHEIRPAELEQSVAWLAGLAAQEGPPA